MRILGGIWVVALLLPSFFCSAQSVRSLMADFIRVTVTEQSADTVLGTLYYASPATTVISVTSPLRQWMKVDGDETLVYYPQEQTALRILRNAAAPVQFFQAFLSAGQSDFGLSDAGFGLDSTVLREDSLYLLWHPPQAISKQLAGAELIFTNDRLARATFRARKGRIASESCFEDHVAYGGSMYPRKLILRRFAGAHEEVETILWSNLQFDAVLPDSVVHLRIPPDVPIEEVRW